jgi:hypothetical protein
VRIEHQHDDVGLLDGLQRLDHRELLDRLEHLAAAAQTSGIDQRVTFCPSRSNVDRDRIACGARLIESDHTLLADQAR